MIDLSVRGIARRFCGLSGVVRVKKDMASAATMPISLRACLMSLSHFSVKKAIPDCGVSIDQSYDQVWAHVIVRLRVVPQNVGNLPTPLEQWQEFWKMGIEAVWNRRLPTSFPTGAFHKTKGRAEQFWSGVEEDAKQQSQDPDYWMKHWACSRDGELPCRLSFELQWVETSEHHTILVGDVAAAGSSDESNWRLLPTGEGLTLTGAAHEYGHMLGFTHDRVPSATCDDETSDRRSFFGDHPNDPSFPWRRTVMCAVAVYGQLPSHLVRQFADNLGCKIVLMDKESAG